VDVLLAALVALPGARARIVGGHPAEPDLERLRRLAERLGLGARVEFTGLVAPRDVEGHLVTSTVLVLPNRATAISSRYTSPLKLFEYLAAGRAIVASDLPSIREILRDGENAILVPPDDADALARAIDRLLRDPGLAETLARTAFDDAERFTWAARAEALERVFEEALGLR
jgi:glycosyltransferase involved in cell wall biosynthesis